MQKSKNRLKKCLYIYCKGLSVASQLFKRPSDWLSAALWLFKFL